VRSVIRSQRSRKQDLPLPELEPGTPDKTGGVLAWEAIENCWDRLPPREHQVFALRYLQEMSLKETALALGSNVNAIGQSIFRLVRKMRDCLSRAGYGGEFPGSDKEDP
jgi:DNA-directed RNA polymerase specialized sigma24 family protein